MAHHGNTPAAWTGVLLILVGFTVAGIGLVAGSWVVFWIGVAFGPIGIVVGRIMQGMGMGAETVAADPRR
ncbi:MAG: HGxxPAAW family protein [Nocardioidaceae bacterium]